MTSRKTQGSVTSAVDTGAQLMVLSSRDAEVVLGRVHLRRSATKSVDGTVGSVLGGNGSNDM